MKDLPELTIKETACYILKTRAGLVVIDGIWPDQRVYDEILRSIAEARWDGKEISNPISGSFVRQRSCAIITHNKKRREDIICL